MEQTVRMIISKAKSEAVDRYRHFWRFGMVGVINTAVDFSAFAFLHSFWGIDKLISQAAGYSAGLVNSFILNKSWTFENKATRQETIRQSSKFIVVNALSLTVTLLGLKFLNENLGLSTYLSKVVVTLLAQLINFAGYKLWVFSCGKGDQGCKEV